MSLAGGRSTRHYARACDWKRRRKKRPPSMKQSSALLLDAPRRSNLQPQPEASSDLAPANPAWPPDAAAASGPFPPSPPSVLDCPPLPPLVTPPQLTAWSEKRECESPVHRAKRSFRSTGSFVFRGRRRSRHRLPRLLEKARFQRNEARVPRYPRGPRHRKSTEERS